MGDHLKFSHHLKGAEFDGAIRQTFLGQAHIAGTGPEGKTCRECSLWCVIRSVKDHTGQRVTVHEPPGYNAESHKLAPFELKRARCNYRIANKAKRNVPHYAKACRFFEQNENPPLPRTEPKAKTPKKAKRAKVKHT